jgi:hypothetical protein
MEQKIATPQELDRLKQYAKEIIDKYALDWKALMDKYETQDGFSFVFDKYWRSPEGRGLFIKVHPNKESLTPQERKEWEDIRQHNIKEIGDLLKELILEYQQEYDNETDELKKSRILWVINSLQEDYDDYFGHILEPSKYASNESKSYLKKLIRESLNAIFEADSDGEKRKMIVLVGPPSVGKSTWIKSNFPNAYIINRDDIVEKVAASYGWSYDDIYVTPPSDAEIGDVDEKFGNVIPAPEWMTWTKTVFDKVKEANEKIKPLMNYRMSGAHDSDQDVVVDLTHMTKSERDMTMQDLESGGDEYYKVAVDFKFKGAEDVIKRVSEKRAEAAKRMGKPKTIPSASFDRMFSSYEEPTKDEGFDEIISVDNIENLKRALSDDGENLNESIINIIRESVNK